MDNQFVIMESRTERDKNELKCLFVLVVMCSRRPMRDDVFRSGLLDEKCQLE